MDFFQSQNYLLIFLGLGLLHLTRQIFLYLNFWQLKQYRWDRLRDGLRTNPWLLFPKSSMIFLLILPSLFLSKKLFLILTLVNIFVWGGYAGGQLLRKRWIYPKATKKAKIFFLTEWLLLLILMILGFFNFQTYLFIIFPLLLIFAPVIILVGFHLIEYGAMFFKRRTIEKALHQREKFPNLKVIGITGSFGKTSVKHFLYHFLSYKYGSSATVQTEGNINTQIGIAQTILNKISGKTKFFICEMGAYRLGEISQSSFLAKPQVGILTGINDQHLSLFGSRENIISAKYELIESLPKQGLAVFNGDNERSYSLYQKTTQEKILIASQEKSSADWWASNVQIDKKSLSFEMINSNYAIPIKANLIGEQNVINLMMAGAVALEMGLTRDELAEAMKTITYPVKSPSIFHYHGAEVIDASYSSNPDGSIAHVNHLEKWSGKRILVMSGFLELGKKTKEAYYELGRSIGICCHLAIFIDNKYQAEVERGIREVKGKTRILGINDSQKIIRELQEFRNPEDVILIEGRVRPEIIDSLKRS
jgi:UDP-N-acetylmuramoyl-tripeptide--D-alanyl-D-alanine ligase